MYKNRDRWLSLIFVAVESSLIMEITGIPVIYSLIVPIRLEIHGKYEIS